MKTIPTSLSLLVTTAAAIALAIPTPAEAAPDKKGKSTTDATKEAPAEDAKPKDLLADVSEEWIREFDTTHGEWATRAKLVRENYVTYTDAGYEVLVFHATGNGGQAMESDGGSLINLKMVRTIGFDHLPKRCESVLCQWLNLQCPDENFVSYENSG